MQAEALSPVPPQTETRDKPKRTRKPRPPLAEAMLALLLDLETVSALLAMSLKSVKRLIALDQLPGIRRIGRRVLVSRAELESWVAKGCPRIALRHRP